MIIIKRLWLRDMLRQVSTPAIPAPHRLISVCLTLAILETQVLTMSFEQKCESFLVREREVRHGANCGYG